MNWQHPHTVRAGDGAGPPLTSQAQFRSQRKHDGHQMPALNIPSAHVSIQCLPAQHNKGATVSRVSRTLRELPIMPWIPPRAFYQNNKTKKAQLAAFTDVLPGWSHFKNRMIWSRNLLAKKSMFSFFSIKEKEIWKLWVSKLQNCHISNGLFLPLSRSSVLPIFSTSNSLLLVSITNHSVVSTRGLLLLNIWLGWIKKDIERKHHLLTLENGKAFCDTWKFLLLRT